jgi:hypothetical protein
MARSSIIAALLGIAAIATPRYDAGEPSLKDVLRRMGSYVEAYGEKASIVVATERYAQHAKGSGRIAQEHRITVADFAIVKAEGFGGWVGFRDVIEADGARIADHADRLLKILSDVSGSLDEAKRLSDESARFNIGPISRNFNVPTAALFFFRPENFERFKFTKKNVEPDGTWEIGFRETTRPTLIRTPDGGFVPTEGSVWVNATSGTVVRTSLRVSEFGTSRDVEARGYGSGQIDVTYGRVAGLDMWLPDTMTETYEVIRGASWERTATEAKYSEYRVFQTSIRIK